MDKRKKSSKKLNVKRIVILILIVLIAVVSLGLAFKQDDDREAKEKEQQALVEANKNYQTLEDGTQVNISQKAMEDKSIDSLIVTNTQITRKNGITTIVADVKNNSTETQGGFSVNLIFMEKDGDKITQLVGYIEKLSPGATAELLVSGSYDFVDAYDYKIERKQAVTTTTKE